MSPRSLRPQHTLVLPALLAMCGACLAPQVLAQDEADFDGTCPNGAQAKAARLCSFFVHFDNDNSEPLDARISDALEVKPGETRSIGLVISIGNYPNVPGFDVSAAEVDGQRLVDFLVKHQKFDEVIHLNNADATAENIDYFLDEYLPSRGGQFHGKARLVIAFSGHGRYGTRDGTTDRQPAFLLSKVSDVNGSAHVYKMGTLTTAVKVLAGRYFHVLTLLNACHGAGFFSGGAAGNAANVYGPGSHGITAGSRTDIVPALDPARGSLFFDLIIDGVIRGKADPHYADFAESVGLDGTSLGRETVARTAALALYLTSAYDKIRRQRKRSDPGFQLSPPYMGAVQEHGDAPGGFFFLSERDRGTTLSAAELYLRQPEGVAAPPPVAAEPVPAVAAPPPVPSESAPTAPPTSARDPASVASWGYQHSISERASSTTIAALASRTAEVEKLLVELHDAPRAPVTIPPGPVSSVPGRPDIKIFKAPRIYPVKGQSHLARGSGTGQRVLDRGARPRFVYTRALGWSGPERGFAARWREAQARGIDRGAYITYDFCRSPAEQLARTAALVSVEPDALPIGIELVYPGVGNRRQLGCLAEGTLATARTNILAFAALLQAHYGKVPLLYGNTENLATFLDARAETYMVWLGSYGTKTRRLAGRNPWTLWQYASSVGRKGGDRKTGEVFFGTEEQYLQFKEGKTNVALWAVQDG